MTTETKEYTVAVTGRIAGIRRKKGDTVDLTEAQAKYEKVTLSRKGQAQVRAEAEAKEKAEAEARQAAEAAEKAEAEKAEKAAEADKRKSASK